MVGRRFYVIVLCAREFALRQTEVLLLPSSVGLSLTLLHSIDSMLHDYIVLCGRGGLINGSPGNIQFRDIVASRKKEYNAKSTKRNEKAHLAATIVRQIRNLNPPGRFLREDTNGMWFDIGDAKAIRKTGQALREAAPTIRQELEEQQEGEAGEEEGERSGSPSNNAGDEAADKTKGDEGDNKATEEQKSATSVNKDTKGKAAKAPTPKPKKETKKKESVKEKKSPSPTRDHQDDNRSEISSSSTVTKRSWKNPMSLLGVGRGSQASQVAAAADASPMTSHGYPAQYAMSPPSPAGGGPHHHVMAMSTMPRMSHGAVFSERRKSTSNNNVDDDNNVHDDNQSPPFGATANAPLPPEQQQQYHYHHAQPPPQFTYPPHHQMQMYPPPHTMAPPHSMPPPYPMHHPSHPHPMAHQYPNQYSYPPHLHHPAPPPLHAAGSHAHGLQPQAPPMSPQNNNGGGMMYPQYGTNNPYHLTTGDAFGMAFHPTSSAGSDINMERSDVGSSTLMSDISGLSSTMTAQPPPGKRQATTTTSTRALGPFGRATNASAPRAAPTAATSEFDGVPAMLGNVAAMPPPSSTNNEDTTSSLLDIHNADGLEEDVEMLSLCGGGALSSLAMGSVVSSSAEGPKKERQRPQQQEQYPNAANRPESVGSSNGSNASTVPQQQHQKQPKLRWSLRKPNKLKTEPPVPEQQQQQQEFYKEYPTATSSCISGSGKSEISLPSSCGYVHRVEGFLRLDVFLC